MKLMVQLGSISSGNCADTVGQPAIEERFVGGASLGKSKVTFALQRFERAHHHRLAAAFPRAAR